MIVTKVTSQEHRLAVSQEIVEEIALYLPMKEAFWTLTYLGSGADLYTQRVVNYTWDNNGPCICVNLYKYYVGTQGTQITLISRDKQENLASSRNEYFWKRWFLRHPEATKRHRCAYDKLFRPWIAARYEAQGLPGIQGKIGLATAILFDCESITSDFIEHRVPFEDDYAEGFKSPSTKHTSIWTYSSAENQWTFEEKESIFIELFAFRPFFCAAIKGNTKAIQYLISQGVDIHETLTSIRYDDKKESNSKHGKNALHFAAIFGKIEVAAMLIEAGVQQVPDKNSQNTPLHDAALNGHPELVELLIQNNGDVQAENLHGHKPLFLAVHSGHIPTIEMLLKHIEPISLLRHKGLKKGNFDALEEAIDSKNFDVSKILLEHIPKDAPFNSINSLCERIVAKDSVEVLKIAATHFSINLLQPYGIFEDETLFEYACRQGSLETMTYLHTLGANIDRANRESKTPLYYAMDDYLFSDNMGRVIELLLQWGARIPPYGSFTSYRTENIQFKKMYMSLNARSTYSWATSFIGQITF